MKKEIRFYNVLFPIWMLLLFWQTWMVVLPGNFLFDSLVLYLAMRSMKLPEKMCFYKKHIWWIFLFGMLADFIGAGCLFGVLYLDWSHTGDELYFTIPAMILSGILIYVFNYCVTFRKCEKPLRRRLSLTLAIATAPYTFVIPVSWIY